MRSVLPLFLYLPFSNMCPPPMGGAAALKRTTTDRGKRPTETSPPWPSSSLPPSAIMLNAQPAPYVYRGREEAASAQPPKKVQLVVSPLPLSAAGKGNRMDGGRKRRRRGKKRRRGGRRCANALLSLLLGGKPDGEERRGRDPISFPPSPSSSHLLIK